MLFVLVYFIELDDVWVVSTSQYRNLLLQQVNVSLNDIPRDAFDSEALARVRDPGCQPHDSESPHSDLLPYSVDAIYVFIRKSLVDLIG